MGCGTTAVASEPPRCWLGGGPWCDPAGLARPDQTHLVRADVRPGAQDTDRPHDVRGLLDMAAQRWATAVVNVGPRLEDLSRWADR